MNHPPLPQSWSTLTWQQLWDCWTAKLRYGGSPDAARAAALLALCRCSVCCNTVAAPATDPDTVEPLYTLRDADGQLWTVTPRQLAHLAQQALPWFLYPYGDHGKEAVKDEKGKVIEEAVAPHTGYVNPNWRDAMQLPEQEVVVSGREIIPLTAWTLTDKEHGCAVHFALPELACTNIVWHQYRALQGLTQQMFQEGITDDAALELQAQFLAYCLVPEQQQSEILTDRFARQHRFKYDADRAEQSVAFWQPLLAAPDAPAAPLYAICFQVYQTSMHYYEQVFPLLFSGGGKSDPLHDALTGEVDTINSVMKYQGYTDPQQVYDTNLPIILSVLNTMTKEAKEIEKMNAKIKRK